MKRSALSLLSLLFMVVQVVAEEGPKSFGDRQLAQLLDDRPSMKKILPADDTICQWVIRHFNTGDRSKRVYWDHREPLSGREAENSPSQNSIPAFIRITESDEVSGRDKWYMLVFEFENLQNSVYFGGLDQLAFAGDISRDEFALQCAQLELNAQQRTRRYFQRYPINGATAENALQYTRLLETTNDMANYIAWLDSRGSQEYDPREYFAKWFDRCRAYSKSYGLNAKMGSAMR